MLSMLKKYTILYVEDEPEIQANIAEYLGHYFAEIYLASNGKEALALYKQHAPDALLLDINLPLLDGLRVAKTIRQHDQTIKIIMLTAHADKEKLLKATELKLTKYLIKPVPPKIFKATLHLLAEELAQDPTRFLSLCEHYRWDRQQELLLLADVPIALSEKEQKLLKLFIRHRKALITYEMVVSAVWENGFKREISTDSIKNQVSCLRKKLPKGCIASVYGEGYILK